MLAQQDQELAVPGVSGNGRWDGINQDYIISGSHPSLDSGEDIGTERVAPDDPALADLAAASLELGLDERNGVAARLQVRQRLRQGHGEGYKGNVGDEEIDGLRQRQRDTGR